MAYIDPEGMFGGDRMAMLSDSAKFAWPWFWCASNSVGRVELNYREFANGPFRQFKKPPTEKQFWEWVAEFHEQWLMFVYQVNGQAWGQWDVSERYLPKYKLEGDKRTPAPIAADFLAWRDEYQKRKIADLSGKCRIFSNSGNFQNSRKGSEDFPIGEERRGEEKPSCAAVAPQAGELALMEVGTPLQSKPATTDAWLDSEHDRWYRDSYWCHQDRAGSRKAFKKRIRALMSSTHQSAEQCIAFLHETARQDRARFESTQAWEWRQNLYPATWLNGERWNDQPPKNERVSRGRSNFVDNVTRQIEESLAKGESPW